MSRVIPGYRDGYAVSDSGEVFTRFPDNGAGPLLSDWRKKLPFLHNGYLVVGLWDSGHRVNRFVHRLVLEAFVGPCPTGHQASHLNGQRSDNHADNLVWSTCKENHARKHLHGTMARGSHNGQSKLKEPDVQKIRRRLSEGESQEAIARDFGVSQRAISAIKMGRTWSHA